MGVTYVKILCKSLNKIGQTMIYESFSQKDTENIGYETAQKASVGQVYCLTGELGAGKTAFARGFAKGLGIQENITSPTFSIVNEYNGRLRLFHFDVYRIKNIQEMEDAGYEEYFYGIGVTLVEWADMITEIWPKDTVVICIERDILLGDDFRRISIKPMTKGE